MQHTSHIEAPFDIVLRNLFQHITNLCSAILSGHELHAVLINELIRIDSGPKIPRSSFLHWLYDKQTIGTRIDPPSVLYV